MTAARMLSPAGLALIKRFEGYRPDPAPLDAGRVLVGYGRVIPAQGLRPLGQAEAEAALRADLAPAVAAVDAAAPQTLTQAQFDALVSLAFSIGVPAFLTSDVLRRLKAGHLIAAADAFDVWRRSGGLTLPALVVRRAAEKALFLSAVPVEAPSALVRPQPDFSFALASAPGPLAAFMPPAAPPIPEPSPIPEPPSAAARAQTVEPLAAAAPPPEDPDADMARLDALLAEETTAAGARPMEEGAEARLRAVLGAEPQTAEALRPAPDPAPKAEPGPAAPPASAKPARLLNTTGDVIGLLGLAGFGALMLIGCALALAGGFAEGRWSIPALGAPGALAILMAAYYLARGPERAG